MLVFIQYQWSPGWIAIHVVIIVAHCLRMWVLNDKLKNGFSLSLLRSHLHYSQSVCCCISLSLNRTDYSCQPRSLDSFARLIMKSLVPAQTQFLRCNTNIPSDSAEAKLNSSNDIAQVFFLPFFSDALIKEKTCRCRKNIPLSCYRYWKGSCVPGFLSTLFL